MLQPYLIGAGAAAAATFAGWHSMSPVSQVFGGTFTGLPSTIERRVAFTFDDGPNDPWTGRLLDVLARHNIRATFFMIGRYVAQHPQLARMVAEAGHEVANHTFAHPNLIFTSPAQVRREIGDCRAALYDAGIQPAPYFRPPFGARRPDVLRIVEREAGLQTIMWRASSQDWKLPSSAAIVKKVGEQVRGGEVILMHDGSDRGFGWDRAYTVSAVDELITRCGYSAMTVGEMLNKAAAQ